MPFTPSAMTWEKIQPLLCWELPQLHSRHCPGLSLANSFNKQCFSLLQRTQAPWCRERQSWLQEARATVGEGLRVLPSYSGGDVASSTVLKGYLAGSWTRLWFGPQLCSPAPAEFPDGFTFEWDLAFNSHGCLSPKVKDDSHSIILLSVSTQRAWR